MSTDPSIAHAELIRILYDAFGRRDHRAMAACYSPDARFSDPVFVELTGSAIPAMWRMLCERGTDLLVSASAIVCNDNAGTAHWEARYTFLTTGRRVHNVIEAQFEFAGGRIQRHTDQFSFHRWSRQALGPTGTMLGWTPLLRNKVRKQAAHNLAAFIAAHPEPVRIDI